MRYMINEDKVEAAMLTRKYRDILRKIRDYTEQHNTQTLDVFLLCASVPSTKKLVQAIIRDFVKKGVLVPELYKEQSK